MVLSMSANQLAYMMIPKQITAPTEHGVHKKSGKNKRENQGFVYRKNPRIRYSGQIVTRADYYIECFRKTDRHSKQITILNALGKHQEQMNTTNLSFFDIVS